MRHIHIDDLERIPYEFGVYRPIRRALGVSAFGINAYSADGAGELVLEPHDEAKTNHEELYLVLSGRAEFKVGDETLDAPAGTLVLVAPREHREATAREAGTTVLAIGGDEGAAGKVSPWEYWRAATPAYDAGDHGRAYEKASEGLAEHPDDARLHYNLACYAALDGRLDVAREHLEKAFAGEPKARQWAETDDDLAALR
jgi:mannose-6-phosphate isomerase-like protein (cupin superfamily)